MVYEFVIVESQKQKIGTTKYTELTQNEHGRDGPINSDDRRGAKNIV